MREAMTKTRRTSLLGVLVMCLALLAGCGGDDEGSSSGGGEESADAPMSAEVPIASFKFLPENVRVKKGGTVTWTNEDTAPHTAETGTQPEGEFDTGDLETGDSKSIKFDTPGKIPYYCIYHRFMTATVEVVE